MSQDKKTLIYEAALSLVYENYDLSRIKVADIAERADIGKGTVYEYFQSKEQVIGEALIYMFKKGLKSFEAVVDENRGFKETYLLFLNDFKSMLRENKNLYNFMTMNPSNLAVHATIQTIMRDEMKGIRRKYFQVIERLVGRSIQEGLIKANRSRFDWQTAVLSSLTCIFLQQEFQDEFTLTDEDVLEKAYTAYLKLLN